MQEAIINLYCKIVLGLCLLSISPSLATVTAGNSHSTVERVNFPKLSRDEQQVIAQSLPNREFLNLILVNKELFTNIYTIKFERIREYDLAKGKTDKNWQSLLNYLQEAQLHNRRVSLNFKYVGQHIEDLETDLENYWNIVKYLNFHCCFLKNVNFLPKCPQLEELFIFRAYSRDISPIGELTRLKKLKISDIQVSDLSPLAKLTQLKNLDVSYTLISDLSPLANLLKLEILDLIETQVVYVTALAKLVQLETLSLSNTQIKDVSALGTLLQLKRLTLYNTPVSDVSALGNLPQLTMLYLHNTKVKDVRELRSKNPELEIEM
jgi:Leucine-rich repeat (LRR) protein